jgi:glycine cleavage system regulatory protein
MALVEGRMNSADGLFTNRLQVSGDAAMVMTLMESLDRLGATFRQSCENRDVGR